MSDSYLQILILFFERLLVLIAEHETGHNNAYIEGSSILDELLRVNAINQNQYATLFSLLND